MEECPTVKNFLQKYLQDMNNNEKLTVMERRKSRFEVNWRNCKTRFIFAKSRFRFHSHDALQTHLEQTSLYFEQTADV